MILDGRGAAYVQAQLRVGNPLAQQLLRDVEIERGRTYALVPAAPNLDVYAFEHAFPRSEERIRTEVEGGYLEHVVTTRRAVLPHVRSALNSCSRMHLICESYMLRARDIPVSVMENTMGIAYLPGRTLLHGEYVYHLARGADDAQTLEAVLGVAYQLPVGLGVLFELDNSEALSQGPNVGVLTDLGIVTRALRTLLLSAYDGESLVAWDRPDDVCGLAHSLAVDGVQPAAP